MEAEQVRLGWCEWCEYAENGETRALRKRKAPKNARINVMQKKVRVALRTWTNRWLREVQHSGVRDIPWVT